VKAQIHYKEQVVTDEATVAKALENFSRVFYALSFKEREELMRLLIKSLRVSKIDPTKDALPCAIDAVNTNTPIQYYRIDIEFFIQSIFATPHASVEANDPDSTAAKGKKIRTRMNSTFIVGLIGQRWESGAFLIHPFKLDKQPQTKAQSHPKFRLLSNRHSLESVLEWIRILKEHPHLTPKDIADKIGLSVITVRQLLQLGKLSPEIQTYILNLKPKDAIKRFSQKKLRKLPPLSHEEQHKEFKKEWELEL
jgi:hypothetical protein